MLRAMQWRWFASGLALVCASLSVTYPSPSQGQDVAPAIEPSPDSHSGAASRRAGRAKPQTQPQEPAPEPPPPVPVQPPEPAPSAEAPAQAPEPPPAPASAGDYAGTHGTAAAGGEDSLASDTDEEPEAQFREQEHREFSVRVDPLNWLLLGRFGIELEMTAWKFISVELIPVFVTSSEPLLLNYSRFDGTLTQHSRGIGPISGASLGAGVWLFGEPFTGYVIRLNFTNYAYSYRAADGGGTFDRVDVTERRLALFFGSHSRFGPFTLAGGFGLGLELNQNDRCGLVRVSSGSDDNASRVTGRSSNCGGRQLIALNRTATDTADLNGPLHPVYFEARFSFGLVF
jgi:hypothetical protein